MSEWQPIETAPKGVPVILWDKCYNEPVVGKFEHGYWWINNSYGLNEDGEIPSKDITHWMPYASPPP